jgi:RNA polymerase sigma-70 factor (ECF subfamily)
MHQEDQLLVRQLLVTDERAFHLFFQDYFPRLFRFILRRVDGDEELARDIAQAALTKGVRKLQLYRGEASLFTWFCQIARYELADHSARNARQRLVPSSLVTREDDPAIRASLESIPSDGDAEPEAVRHREELAALVHMALDYLPHRYAQVLELKYLEDLPVDKIAERLDVTAITVQSLLARARAAFREVCGTLEQDFEDLEPIRPTPIGGGT